MDDLHFDDWSLVQHHLQPVAQFFGQAGVTEIMINRYDTVFIERYGQKERVEAGWASEFDLQSCIEQIANALGQQVHPDANPLLDARLPMGARVNALLAPYAADGHCMTIRLFPSEPLTAEDLLKTGSFNEPMLAFFKQVMEEGRNVVLAGGTGSGKTTLLRVLANFIPDDERIISIEDTLELRLQKPHLVQTEAAKRGARADRLQVTMGMLLKNVLRQNPDRIVVGEIRDAEAATTYLEAINTGHSGVISTYHANSPKDALARLCNLAAGSADKKPYEVIQAEVRQNIEIIIQVKKFKGQGRRVSEVAALDNGELVPLWRYDEGGRRHIDCR